MMFMKKNVFILVMLMALAFSVCAQGAGSTGIAYTESDAKLKITVGNKVFTATMYDNATAKALMAKLPLTLNMTEFNGNKKYCNLPENFLADSPSSAGTIRAGELMCWQSNCIVIFYKTFSSNNSYVRLGRIEDISGLEAALGTGNVTVAFTVDDQ
jgi:hypothetical protein